MSSFHFEKHTPKRKFKINKNWLGPKMVKMVIDLDKAKKFFFKVSLYF